VLRLRTKVTVNSLSAGAPTRGRVLRLLAHEPHDEQAHRGLVAALTAVGGHGAAVRAEARVTDAMGAPS